jgi:hypothetical protein
VELDELKQVWASLEATRSSNEQLLRELRLGRIRSSLLPSRLWRGIEVVLGLLVLFACAPVVLAHHAAWRYLCFGIPSLAFMAATTATSAYLFVRTGHLDLDGPILASQRDVAKLRRVELRATLVALLGGVVLWLPIGLLLLEAITGMPLLGRADRSWLVSNVAFGLLVLAIGHAWARRHLWTPTSPIARRVVDALTGHGLRAVSARLDELARFSD